MLWMTVSPLRWLLLKPTRKRRSPLNHIGPIKRLNVGCSSNISRGVRTNAGCFISKRQALRIETWNVSSLYTTGKLDNAIKEARYMNIGILGLSEVRWTRSAKIQKEHRTILYLEGDNHTRGVGIIINKDDLLESP